MKYLLYPFTFLLFGFIKFIDCVFGAVYDAFHDALNYYFPSDKGSKT